MRRLLVFVSTLVALSARAHDVPDPPDTCLDSAQGAACKPYLGPTGTCTWLSAEERNFMELPGKARCESEGTLCTRYLMCVSDSFRGDTAALLVGVEELTAAKRTEEADALLRYLKWSERAPRDRLAVLWHRLGKVEDDLRRVSSASYYQAIGCDPRLYAAYLDVAAYWASSLKTNYERSMAAGALLHLSRALANFDASAAEWETQARLIATDPRLQGLRASPAYADITQRFARGMRMAAAGLPHAYCRLEAVPAKGWNTPADKMNCALPAGVTACPDLYFKVRAADEPAGLSPCKQ